MSGAPEPSGVVEPDPEVPARRLFVFDCYDTLVVERDPASAPDLAGIFACQLQVSLPMAKRLLYPVLAAAFRPTLAQERTDTALARGLDRCGLDRSVPEARQALWHAVGNADGRYRAAEGAVDLLRNVKDAGHATRMLSNCVLGEAAMHRLLVETGLAEYLDECHFSSQGYGKKPDTRFFARAARGHWSDIVMVGDSPVLDMEPARELGWRTVQVRSGRPSWDLVAAYVRGPGRTCEAP